MNTLYYLSSLMLSAVSTLPCAIGCYISYWNRLKVRPAILIPLLCALFLLETVIMGLFTDDLSSNLAFCVLVLLNLLCFFKTIDAENGQLLFVFLLFIQFGAVMRSIHYFIESNYLSFHSTFTPPSSTSEFLVYALELVSTFIIMILLGFNLKKHFIPLINTLNIRRWHILFAIPLAFPVIILGIVSLLDDDTDTISYLLLMLSIAIESIITYYVIFKILCGLSENAALREQNMELEFREQYYSLMISKIETAKQTRHDFRHHLRLLTDFLEREDYDRARAYLKEYVQSTNFDDESFYCAHPATNMILNHYAGLAHGLGIKMTVSARLPETLFLHTPDLCVLLGNSLENAIEGCQRQPDTALRWIRVHLTADDHKMALAIDNSCGRTNRSPLGEFFSTKSDRHGTGLSSLHAIAKKYGGNAWFEEADGVFEASIVLHHHS